MAKHKFAKDKHGKCFCDAGTKPMEADHLHKTLRLGMWCITDSPNFVRKWRGGDELLLSLRSMSPSFLECLFMAVIRFSAFP